MGYHSGEALAGYTIIRRLGRGTMATVYKVQDADGQIYAMKVLPEDEVDTGQSLRRFQQEAQLAARLNHPHIVPVYDSGTADRVHYMVMKYLEGGTLARLLHEPHEKGLPLPGLNRLYRIFHALADALDYAHSENVIHRDVKPGNVMFDSEFNVYLVDFSIARYTMTPAHITSSSGWVGTPSFMPPEQWRGDPPVPASDQYALAVMLFLLACGEVPFRADNYPALMNRHLNDPPPRLSLHRPAISPAVDPVLARAMAKNPHDRYPGVVAFIEAFGDAAFHSPDDSDIAYKLREPVQLTEAGTPAAGSPDRKNRPRTDKKQRQHWWSFQWGGALLLVISLLVAGALVAFRDDFLPGEEDAPAEQPVMMGVARGGAAPILQPSHNRTAVSLPPVAAHHLTVTAGLAMLHVPAGYFMWYPGADRLLPLRGMCNDAVCAFNLRQPVRQVCQKSHFSEDKTTLSAAHIPVQQVCLR